ncbi:MAG: PEP-CTERM sorting domain-containing protein [Lentimonas sp.]
MKIISLILVATCAAVLSVSAETVFSNNFEDGDFDADIGSWSFAAGTATTSVINTLATDATLGDKVGLIDQGTTKLDATLDFTDVSLTGGNTVTIDFDVAFRRTNGISKTIFVDALDSQGDIVVRFVLGDAGAFGNGGNDRQRPGHDPTSLGNASTENSTFGSPPGSFWWGGDTSPTTFATTVDSHMSLSIGATSFDFATTKQSGASYSTTDVGNRDAGTYADIAEIKLSSQGTVYGFYLDNFVVTGTVPEPSTYALLGGLTALAFVAMRRRQS